MQEIILKPTSTWVPPQSFPDLSEAKEIAVDCETCDPNIRTRGPGGVRGDGFVVGISIATDTGYKGYFPFAHQGGGNLDKGMVIRWAKNLLKNENQEKIFTNCGYDLEWLATLGVEIKGKIHDIQLAGPLLDEERESYSLQCLCLDYGVSGKNEELLASVASDYGLDPKQDLWKLHAKYVGAYAEQDALSTLGVWHKQRTMLGKNDLWNVYNLERDLIPLLSLMRKRGVRVDLERAHKVSKDLRGKENDLQKKIDTLAGCPVDAWSGQDLERIADKLKIPYPRTEKGNASFTKGFLSLSENEFLKTVNEFRTINRLRAVYIDEKILKESHNGRIHTQFHQLRSDEHGTVSGRFSSSNPNLQQVPNPERSEFAWLVRSIFIPEEGAFWGKLDYSQQEPRLAVHYGYIRGFDGAEDARKYYLEDEKADFYKIVVDLAGVTRPQAKKIFLARSYGMGVAKFSREVNLPEDEAKNLLEKFDRRLPYIKELANEVSRVAQSRGFVRTLSGRKKHFDFWEPTNKKLLAGKFPMRFEGAQMEWYRESLQRAHTHKAFNHLIQGGSGDMIKMAMVKAYQEIDFVPHLTNHDELDGSFGTQAECEKVKKVMESAYNLTVPIYADLKVGKSWGETK